jgi:glycosyltransferase involved in cell wall biosynthesis
LNILFITDGIYPFTLGGMQKHAYYLVQFFATTKHKLTVVITGDNYLSGEDIAMKLFPKEIPDNIQFHFIPKPKVRNFPGHYLVESWMYSKRVYGAFCNQFQNFDLILAKGFTAWYFTKTKTDLMPPLVSQLHGLEMFQPAYSLNERLVKVLMRLPAKRVIRKSDYILSYGGKIRALVKKLGKPDNQIIEQYGGVDDYWLSEYSEILDKPIRKFLFVARFEYRKGYHILKSVLKNLNAEGHKIEIILVGEIPNMQQLNLPGIKYAGNQTAEQIKKLADECAFLLVPSLSEGFPTILVEGMARGLVPIATNVGAVSAVVNEHTGFLIEPGSENELKQAIIGALTMSQNQFAKMRKAARSMVMNNFLWVKLFAVLILHLQQITDDYRKRIIGTKPN